MLRHPNAPAALTGELAAQRWWPYQPLARYPHMLSDDRLTWEAYLRGYPNQFLAVAYDVHVGQPWQLTADQADDLAAIAAGITRLRIDVCAWDGGNLWVIEVKPANTPGAIGQAITYSVLLSDLDPQPVPIIPAVLSYWHHPALVHGAQQLGIALMTAPEPGQHTPYQLRQRLT